MEGPDRTQTLGLIAQFEQAPHAFDFFRAVRLLEACTRPSGDLPVHMGATRHPREDPIRFGQNPSLAFAPSTIEQFRPAAEGIPARMLVHFFGLFGPNGPLPLHLTEYARDRQLHAKDPAFTDFCDIFHHRLLSLFYRAWAVNQKTVDFDWSENSPVHDSRREDWTGPRFAMYIGSFIGLGMESLRERDEISDWAKLFYSGRLASHTRNAEGLAAIVQDYFGMPTQIHSFFGQWLTLPDSSVCRIGQSPGSGTLGVSTLVGSRFWDCQLKFRIRIGPIKLAELNRMLPIGSSFKKLKSWVLNYIGEELFWDVQLVLLAAEVPQTCLGQGSLLGWTTWLKSTPFSRDADDVILDPGLNYG